MPRRPHQNCYTAIGLTIHDNERLTKCVEAFQRKTPFKVTKADVLRLAISLLEQKVGIKV